MVPYAIAGILMGGALCGMIDAFVPCRLFFDVRLCSLEAVIGMDADVIHSQDDSLRTSPL